MGVPLRFFATSADGLNVSVRYTPTEYELIRELEEAATLELLVETKYSSLQDALANNEALAEGSLVIFKRDSVVEMRGWVKELELFKLRGGKQFIRYLIPCKFDRIRDTMATSGGERIFKLTSPSLTLTTNALKYRGANVFDSSFEFYPDPASAAYLPLVPFAVTGYGGGNTFEISGDHTDEFYADDPPLKLTVRNSSDNDGVFTIASVSFGAGTTSITVNEAVDNSTADGDISSEFRTSFDALTVELSAVATVMVLGTEFRGLPAKGQVKIGTELIPYDGYYQKDDGFWRLDNLVRGGLASTPAIHLVGANVQDLSPQRIHPAGEVFMEGEPTASPGTWERIDKGQFTVQFDEGRFDFQIDPDKMYIAADLAETEPRQGFDNFRCTFLVYDEKSSEAVTFARFTKLLYTGLAVDGGPELAADKFAIDVPSIRLTGVSVFKPTHTIDALEKLRSKIGFEGNGDIALISNYYSSPTDVMNTRTIVQKAQEDHQFYHAVRVEEKRDLSRIYSGIVVSYREGTDRNLIAPHRLFGPVIGENHGSNAQPVASILRQFVERDTAAGWTEGSSPFTAYPGGFTDEQKQGYFKEALVDGLGSTGWGMEWASGNNPGSAVRPFSGWFNDAGGLFVVNRVRALLDFRRKSSTANPIEFRIVGHESYTPPVYDGAGALLTPPVVGAEIPLKGTLHARFPTAGTFDTDDQGAVEMVAEGIGREARAISLNYEGLNRLLDGEWRATIKELNVSGFSRQDVFVQIQDNAAATWSFDKVTSQEVFDLLRAAEIDQQRVLIVPDIGVTSLNGALSLARILLLELRSLQNQWVVEVTPKTPLPERGDTVWLAPYNFRGVVLGVQSKKASRQPERLILRLSDLTQGGV